MKELLPKSILLCIITITSFATLSDAYTVTQLAAVYRSGQVFLTWKNPDALNLKFKVYRSTAAIDETTNLSTCTFLGYVRDHSSENIRKSELKGQTYYFTIDTSSGPLDNSTGLYVSTCTDDQAWYYAVTIENLVTHEEDVQITAGENSLAIPIQESLEIPQPILQDTYTYDEFTAYTYVIWGNNTNASSLPAFNNCGSYGYNFTFFKRSGDSLPLYIYFRNADPFSGVNSEATTGKHLLIMDDWLPNQQSTYWFGYHEDYDIYSPTNEVHTTGTIKSFTQARVKYTIDWILAHMAIDKERVYASGSSHNGLGAALTAELHPDLLAAVWIVVAPIMMHAMTGTDWEQVWCDANYNLPTDIINPHTNLPFKIYELLDMRHMYDFHYDSGIPYIGGVHGKQDYTVGWVESKHWYDSVNITQQGGVWYWDQREHNGDGKQFDDSEIRFDFGRFLVHHSFPAFSNCSINQNPGDGNRDSGDPYGAINGYLDWDDSTLSDDGCHWRIRCFIKDMYVSGILQPQYDSCFADVSLRHTQNFKPQSGDNIRWWVLNMTGEIIQSGYFNYDGISPITIYHAKILRAGSVVVFKIKGCESDNDDNQQRSAGPQIDQLTADGEFYEGDGNPHAEHGNKPNNYDLGKKATDVSEKTSTSLDNDEEIEYPRVRFYRSGSGYVVETDLERKMDVLLRMTDMTGRTILFQRIHMVDGQNEFNLEAYRGNYLFTLYSEEFTYKKKISF